MKILSFDLGDFNRSSAWCFVNRDTGLAEKGGVITDAACLKQLLQRLAPDVVLCEACTMTYLLHDVVQATFPESEFIAANTNAEAWRWSNSKRKTDESDAARLERLHALGELEPVFIPDSRMRCARRLLTYRGSLVAKRTACFNAIRHTCKQNGIALLPDDKAWSDTELTSLEKTLTTQTAETVLNEHNMWCLEILQLIEQLNVLQAQIKVMEEHLRQYAQQEKGCELLQTVPGIGLMVSVAIVAYIGDPKRFRRGRQVASYGGLVPRVFQSGSSCRHGRITKCGNRYLRALLINSSWVLVRHDEEMKKIFHKLTGGSQNKTRRKIAIVAIARRLLVRSWAMLRDQTTWQSIPPSPQLKAS